MSVRGYKAGRVRRIGRLLYAAMAALLPLSPASDARPQQRVVLPAPPLAPDFSAVTTRAEAAKLVRKHRLVRIHLAPTELGGPKTRANITYVTPQAVASHALLIEMLAAYVARDRLNHLEIEPEYKGDSIVPTRLRIKASHNRGGDSFERVIEVWACGFCAPLEPLPDPDGVRDMTT